MFFFNGLGLDRPFHNVEDVFVGMDYFVNVHIFLVFFPRVTKLILTLDIRYIKSNIKQLWRHNQSFILKKGSFEGYYKLIGLMKRHARSTLEYRHGHSQN